MWSVQNADIFYPNCHRGSIAAGNVVTNTNQISIPPNQLHHLTRQTKLWTNTERNITWSPRRTPVSDSKIKLENATATSHDLSSQSVWTCSFQTIVVEAQTYRNIKLYSASPPNWWVVSWTCPQPLKSPAIPLQSIVGNRDSSTHKHIWRPSLTSCRNPLDYLEYSVSVTSVNNFLSLA